MTAKQMWAAIVRRLTGCEVLPKEIKRIRIFETPSVIQAVVEIIPKVPVNEINLTLEIKGEEEEKL
ncbi:MAG: hypothetical protein KAJ19_17985 [Gammaproteobacteria bacterium]|nr:hypothetical protein [Gammaproteobacteria bacterium]